MTFSGNRLKMAGQIFLLKMSKKIVQAEMVLNIITPGILAGHACEVELQVGSVL